MTQTRRIIHHTDPGHGWIGVQLHDLRDLGFRCAADGERWPYAGRVISQYSYVQGSTAYLEEDNDAGAFTTAAEAAGWTLTFESREDGARIRRYPSISPRDLPPKHEPRAGGVIRDCCAVHETGDRLRKFHAEQGDRALFDTHGGTPDDWGAWAPADPQTIGIQAAAFGVPRRIVTEQPTQPRLIGGGTLPLESLPLFGGAST
jgi:hypothetical protein